MNLGEYNSSPSRTFLGVVRHGYLARLCLRGDF